ncbi:BtrH N-terminal domain-containing protein [Paenibacillus yanchengensis]|uniref:BtrH N-terminal domain-containing protein n=1 Tax=Paenibacillus yanchengensis TaxID=2035833 RepID=A0ABW4YM08_9BACL
MCSKQHIVNYLNHLGYPIELLFYNTLENTRDIYDIIIKQKKNRFRYPTNCLQREDFSLIGVNHNCISFESFKKVENVICELVQSGKFVLLWGDEFFLPYRESYLKMHTPHSFLLCEYNSKTESYLVHDLPDFYKYINSHTIRQACDHVDVNLKYLIYFDNGETNKPNINLIMEHYQLFIQKYQDDYYLFDNISDILNNKCDQNFSDNDEIFDLLDNAFSILNGSRLLFSKFLNSIQYEQDIVKKVLDSSALAGLIKNILQKNRLTGTMSVKSIQEKCTLLKEIEMEVIYNLKKKITAVASSK